MNNNIKNLILENEKILLNTFEKYKQSINQFIKKIETINYDVILYDLVVRSFSSKEKVEQENYYNMHGCKSARQIISEHKNELDFSDRPDLFFIQEGDKFTPLEICSMADNYNNQVGMYYLSGKNAVIIKSTVEDNDRPYDDKWIKSEIILRYFMQNENDINVKTLNFSHKSNSVIFNSLMEQELLDIYVFINNHKGLPYVYKGIYHPCGIVSKNKAFLLFKDGHENDIPYDNFEAQFLMSLLYSNSMPNDAFSYPLIVGNDNDFFDYKPKKIKSSKRNIIQQKKISLEVELRGEEMVLEYEKSRLKKLGRGDLADLVENSTLTDMNLGYDIRSYDIDINGNVIDKFIKVKSSVAHNYFDFSLSSIEIEAINNQKVKLYRVYDIYTDCPKYLDISNSFLNLNKKATNYLISK